MSDTVAQAAPAATVTETPAAPAAPATTPAPAAFDWNGLNLPPDLQHVVDSHGFTDPSMVLKSYSHLEKLHGVPPEQIIKLPKSNDAKEWDAVYAKMGRPESADKYVVTVPEGQSADFATAAKAWFHTAGLSQAQVTKLTEQWNAHMDATTKAETAKVEQTNQISVNELKKEWGASYDEKAEIVDRAAETFGMTQDQLQVLKIGLGPKGAMQFLYNIGSKIAVESSTVPGMSSKGGFTMTPEQARAAIDAKRHDRNFSALFNSPDPKQRMEARDEMDRLYKLGYPGTTEYPSVAGRQT